MSWIMADTADGYDLIGDIHGCARALVLLLKKLGYRQYRGCFRHPRRQAIFMGDIVDRGPRIRDALHIVKDMVDHDQAHIVMGNHEFNALAYCTPALEGSGRSYLREHNPRHHRLIAETLEQFACHPKEWQMFLQWFKELPLFLEFAQFRVVHACWDQRLVEAFWSRYQRATIDDDFLHQTIVSRSFEKYCVSRLIRGIDIPLPKGIKIESKDGYIRNRFRAHFWHPDPETYQDVIFQPDPLPPAVAAETLTAEDKNRLFVYELNEKPLFVGHYWQMGVPHPIRPNIACLDYSAVKYGKLVAYRMDNETVLDKKKFVWVEVEPRSPFVPR
ncbi:metallophosphoesterase [Zooshikella ganghwensis]|uniref:Serine/threonine protein phosphatase n=1 Tax=Zooshikella ganghwensis TaxID=202772 RepID=A0A4P9VQ36_9GAMM|nr:metallophosphoesterase [Zooshikella ganghwensis]RDH44859.1 serine/threonine protein phosphatase [Zooshikella ganghwensis]